jgi:hypothetical protein
MGLKSPSDERWDGIGRTAFCDEPMHREEEERPHQDVFGRDHGIWGSAPCSWTFDLVDQDATRTGWTISRAFGSMLGLIGTCDSLLEP